MRSYVDKLRKSYEQFNAYTNLAKHDAAFETASLVPYALGYIGALEIRVEEVEAENERLQNEIEHLKKIINYLAGNLSGDGDQTDCDHSHISCQYRDGYWCKAGHERQKQCWINVADRDVKMGYTE